jgi:DNA-binding SARP family transcriptional activator
VGESFTGRDQAGWGRREDTTKFHVLGPLRADPGPGEAAPELHRREQALLATLLLFHGRPCGRDLLVRSVWGERPPRHPAAALRVCMTRARQALGPAGGVLARSGAGYRASPDPCDLDVARFQSRLAAARRSLRAGELAAADGELGEALSCWEGGGPAAPEADSSAAPEVAAEAAVLAEQRRWARLAARDVQIDLGNSAAVLPALRSAVIDDPLSERAWEQLVLALELCGRRDEAVAAYTRAREVSISENGTEPGPDLRGLLEAVQSGQAGETRLTARYQVPELS